MIRTQNPVVLGKYSEPEPDIAIVKRKENYYADAHPAPEEIFLIIEVADSSLEKDRQAKLPLYADALIPEYWIINLDQRELEVYQSPSNDKYLSKRIFLPGSEATLEPFDLSFPVDDLLI